MAKITKRSLLSAPFFAAASLPALRAEDARAQPSECVPETASAPTYNLPMASGRFTATEQSLKTYETPSWFRDAKFGIWAHWGPQAVPRAGDWYARNMYIPGHPHYDHHIRTYGHPTETGYKDIIPLWKAERFDPEALMRLYARAGAKYFVSMGVHHDNFDLWNSRHHRWNAAQMGPMRDIVGAFRRAARRRGLRFGVSEHLGPSYAWFHPSHMYDQVWPKGGISYDGANPEFADLYHPAHNEPFRWGRSWYATNPQWHQKWYDRIKDLVDQHLPDLLYTDGGIPFGEVGRSMVAHLYNSSMARHGGRLEAVYTSKDLGTGEFFKEAGVQDVERGVMAGVQPLPWQTDTSIGDWYYSEGYQYKTTAEVVHMLSDIVSKNGNMLLNVVLYPEGDLPPEPRRFLDEMGAWMAINGEAIHGTRPWRTFGEGPTTAQSGHFNEAARYTPQDIRFTTKAGVLYAITLGAPSGQVRIGSLGAGASVAEPPIRAVHILGRNAPVQWTQNADALIINVPDALPSAYATAFKITFT
jgi:alpha-L-fucosidase